MVKIKRRQTQTVKIGNVKIGSSYPVSIQSMIKVSAKDVEASIHEIKKLKEAGCEIVRIAVEDLKDALSIKSIKRRIQLPLVADIHFNYRLALVAIESGADKVRLNPGNIYRSYEVQQVIAAAKSARIPIRIGANSGSLRIKAKDTVQTLVQSVIDYLRVFKRANFHNLVISLKGSSVLDTIYAYEKMARLCDYPFHLGVTATGLELDGVVKSSVGLGVLLFKGIGDTIRISLLGEPKQEVLVAQLLLNSLGLRKFGPELICCPACGRCEVDLLKKAKDFSARLNQLSQRQRSCLSHYKIALMGCMVNGPGEARDATLGIAFSRHKGMLFKRGQIIRSVSLGQGEKILFSMVRQAMKEGKRE